MKRRIFPAVVTIMLAVSPAVVSAAPNAQLVNSVQNRLNILGFKDVDASQLSTSQIAALHMKLTNRTPRFGYGNVRLKQEVKVILGWEKKE